VRSATRSRLGAREASRRPEEAGAVFEITLVLRNSATSRRNLFRSADFSLVVPGAIRHQSAPDAQKRSSPMTPILRSSIPLGELVACSAGTVVEENYIATEERTGTWLVARTFSDLVDSDGGDAAACLVEVESQCERILNGAAAIISRRPQRRHRRRR